MCLINRYRKRMSKRRRCLIAPEQLRRSMRLDVPNNEGFTRIVELARNKTANVARNKTVKLTRSVAVARKS